MDDLVVKIKGDTADALNKTNGLKSALSGLGTHAAGVLKGATVAAGGFALGIGAIAIPISKVGIDFNAMKETALTSFTVMLGSGEKANAMMQDLIKFAAQTPFEFEEIAKSARSLLSANVGPEAMEETLKRVGDVAAGANVPFSELSDIYAKILNQGRLYGEDINQLQGRGIPIIQELSKMYGVTAGEIKKMVEEGKIGAPQIEEAFKRMTGEGGQFKDMMVEQSKTFNGMFSTMLDNFNQLAGKLTEPLFEVLKGGLHEVNEILGSEHMQKAIEEVVELFTDSEDPLGSVANVVFYVAQAFGVSREEAVKWFEKVIALREPLEMLQTKFGEAKEGVAQFWTDAQPHLRNFENWLKTDGALALQEFFRQARELNQVKDEWVQLMGEMHAGASEALKGISGDSEVELPKLVDVVRFVGNGINMQARSALEIQRGIWTGANQLIHGDFVGWGETMTDTEYNIARNLLSAWGIDLDEFVQTTRTKMTEVVEAIKADMRDGIDWLRSLPGEFRSAANDMMQGLIDGFWDNAAAIQQALQDIINQAINAARAVLGLPPIGGSNEFSGLTTGGNTELFGSARSTSGTSFAGAIFNINFMVENAPRTREEAQQSAGLLVDALHAKGIF